MEKIKANNRQPGTTLKNHLEKKGLAVKFQKLVRFFEKRYPHKKGPADHYEPAEEIAAFKGNFNFGFPASDIDSVKFKANAKGEEQPEVTVNFLSLGGPFSPLPVTYLEYIVQRISKKDFALREFLNTFNHRLISLFYKIVRHHAPTASHIDPDKERFSQFIYAFCGLGNKTLRKRMHIPDKFGLNYAGFLKAGTGNKIGLEHIIRSYFHVGVAIEACVGRWEPIPDRQKTKIGIKGQNQILGETFCLGKSAWLQQGRFIIHLKNLTSEQYRDFLPDGVAYKNIKDLTQFYIGPEFDFELKLSIKIEDITVSSFSDKTKLRLGWDFWLNTPQSEIKKSPVAFIQ